jgi:hypothetical protein
MATTIINSQAREKSEFTMLRQIMPDAQFPPDSEANWPTGDKVPNRPTAISPRTINGYFLTRREMQLAKAESLAG